jgi:DnaJ-class molecular chaperone
MRKLVKLRGAHKLPIRGCSECLGKPGNKECKECKGLGVVPTMIYLP